MIIDDIHRAAFIHIPKCGGASVSAQIGGADSYAGFFRRKGVHPALGSIHFAHIPLRFFQQCFPAEFEKVKTYQSYALTRDPHARFASAIFQRLEEFRGVNKMDVTAKLALEEAHEVIEWLRGRGAYCDIEYIHFSRQIDYVALDGLQVVKNVFALEDIAKMAGALEASFGVRFDPARRTNTNFASNNRLLAMLRVARPIYSRLTSWELREQLLLRMQRWNLQKPNLLYDALRQDPAIARNVQDYYADDFALYRAALGRFRGTLLQETRAAASL